MDPREGEQTLVRNLGRFLVYLMGRGGADWSRSYISVTHDQCLYCGDHIADSPLYKQFRICPSCRFHYSMTARERVHLLTDRRSFKEYYRSLVSLDPISFARRGTYRGRLSRDQLRTGLSEAAMVGYCKIGGVPTVLLLLDFGFLGGSMGSVVGEKVALAFELATSKKLPVVMVVSGGGVRLQEGLLSLMQMAKTITAARQLQARGLPLIAVLANPATGQAYASFANLADIILAEPGSLIGVAPMRALREASRGRPLPDDAHTAEYHLRMGLLDRVVDREELPEVLARVLDTLVPTVMPSLRRKDMTSVAITQPGVKPDAWQSVELARRRDRPSARALIERLVLNFVELRGDRLHGDDPTIVGGIGVIRGQRVVLIGQERYPDGDVVVRPGHILPQGFRKAQRLMRLAAKFGLPVITLVDTPGAHVGLDAEEFGAGNALASTMALMAELPVPVIAVLIGQATSEGALALSLADRILMLENAIYTPIALEHAAERLYRSQAQGKTQDVADALKLTAADCLELGVIDGIVPEPEGGAHKDPDATARLVQQALLWELAELRGSSAEKLVRERGRKFRRMGEHSTYFKEAVKREWSALQQRLRRRAQRDLAHAPEAEAREEETTHRRASSYHGGNRGAEENGFQPPSHQPAD